MKNINRRDWLKTSLMGAGSMSLLSGSLTAGTKTAGVKTWSNESMLWEMNPIYDEVKMKARLLANENPFGPSQSVQKAIAASIRSMGFNEIPSHTSFMIFPIEQEGKVFATKMMDQGVGIRVYSIANQPWCRVSMGTMDEMKMFVEALKTATT